MANFGRQLRFQTTLRKIFCFGKINAPQQVFYARYRTSVHRQMTPGGIRVRPGILAVEALNLMQSRHITSVMVADGDHLLGVLHMHDLLRAGVV